MAGPKWMTWKRVDWGFRRMTEENRIWQSDGVIAITARCMQTSV